MQRRNLAKKITINTMKIENSANYFAGLQIASAMRKNEFPRKKCPRRFTTFSQIKTYSFGPARNTCLHLRIISTHDFEINHFKI